MGEPMTVQFATFYLGEYLFAVPVGQVQEVLQQLPHTPAPGASRAVTGLINLRGQVVTALDLRKRLGMPPREARAGSDEPAQSINVVVRAKDEVWSLIVDRIGDVMNVTEEQFEQPPDTLRGPLSDLIVGAYKLDGQLLLQLDVDRALELPADASI
jgi:purine-binding chemotaxis protein CheW